MIKKHIWYSCRMWTMKKLFIAALMFACSDNIGGDGYEFEDAPADAGAADEGLGNDVSFPDAGADKSLGTLQQGLSSPVGYGIDTATQTRCIQGVGVTCGYPSDKVARYRFRASTCNNWWQTRVVESFNSFLTQAEDAGGWDIQDPTPQGVADVYLDCGSAGGSAYGLTTCPLGATQPNPGGGSYRLYSTCVIKIDNTKIEAMAGWSGMTDAQKQKMARNIILHEYMHSVGLGHVTSNPNGTALMVVAPHNTWWNNLRFPSTFELTLIQGYVP